MEVTVRNEIVMKTLNVRRHIMSHVSRINGFFVKRATNQQQYAGCVTTPTQKSQKAKLTIKLYDGVRREAVFINIKITKKFRTAANTELTEFTTVRKYR